MTRARLLKYLIVLAVIAILGGGAVFIGALGPDTAVVERRFADREAWEKGRTDKQRLESEAWDVVVRDSHRNRGLINLVFALGSIIIVATCVRSSLSKANEVSKQQYGLGDAFAKVRRQTSFAFAGTIATVFVVPILESVFMRGHGMYDGEQAFSAIVTIIWFLLLLGISLVLSYLFLKRCSHVNS